MTGAAGKKILIVEDEPALREMMLTSLQQAGYQAVAESDGLAALTRVDKEPFDLAIVDIMMPRLDGLSLVKAIKQHPRTMSISVIFVTAKTDTRSMVQGINLGARHYLTKPFHLKDLLEKVSKALSTAPQK